MRSFRNSSRRSCAVYPSSNRPPYRAKVCAISHALATGSPRAYSEYSTNSRLTRSDAARNASMTKISDPGNLSWKGKPCSPKARREEKWHFNRTQPVKVSIEVPKTGSNAPSPALKCKSTVGLSFPLSASPPRQTRSSPFGRTMISRACFAWPNNLATRWTGPQKKRSGLGSVVT